jgi:hypothetical protein
MGMGRDHAHEVIIRGAPEPPSTKNVRMKTLRILLLCGTAVLLSGCLEATLSEQRHPTRRRYVSYNDHDPYYRVYYREPRGRTYYRRMYYEDDPVYRARVDRRHHYYRPPANRASVHFGF